MQFLCGCHVHILKYSIVRTTKGGGPRELSPYSDWLRAGWAGDRMPVEARFAISVKTGPGAYPSSSTIGTGSLLPGVKRPGRDINHNPGPRLKKG